MNSLQTISASLLAVAMGVTPVVANSTIKALSPVGSWAMATGESKFKVTLCGDGTQLCAQLVWLADSAKTTDNVKLLNKYVLMNAKLALTNKWRGEAQYQGETVKGTITMVDADTMTLNGCKGALCKKFELKRI